MRDNETRSRENAKRLRRQLTSAETILWSQLRRDMFFGLRFRRQHPVGPYIADFACTAAQLVVEIDDGTHSTPAQVSHDRRREAYLRKQGWRVIRVTNTDVYKKLDSVLDYIAVNVEPVRKVPPSRRKRGSPPPRKRGGKKKSSCSRFCTGLRDFVFLPRARGRVVAKRRRGDLTAG